MDGGHRVIMPATGATAMAASNGRRFMRTDAIREDMGDPLFREIASQPTVYAPFGSRRHGSSYPGIPDRIAL